jgi:pimeloyl-ACP methyl ester carboxylesterase
VVILAHGFFNTKDAYLFREIAKAIAVYYDVVAFDFRGHGKSSGLFTWTSKECADLRAVIDYVKSCGYTSVGLMGFSLGAAISLLETAKNQDIKTVIAVSAPYDFRKIEYHFWKPAMLDDLKLNLGYKAKGKGVRPSHPWEPKTAPIDIVDQISPRPVLFIHGAEDWLINPRHSRELYNKAKEPKKIVILEKAGHAETMFDQQPGAFMKPCLDWFADTL